MKNIFKTFEIFLREPLSILREGFLRLVSVETANASQKPSVSVDFQNKKAQITVVNSAKMYGLFKTVMYKKRMLEQEQAGEIIKR